MAGKLRLTRAEHAALPPWQRGDGGRRVVGIRYVCRRCDKHIATLMQSLDPTQRARDLAELARGTPYVFWQGRNLLGDTVTESSDGTVTRVSRRRGLVDESATPGSLRVRLVCLCERPPLDAVRNLERVAEALDALHDIAAAEGAYSKIVSDYA
jgi:hypothetical protein